jgi:hypothetical protein
MSALGQKQTFAPQKCMSALPPKADMCGATRYVRFGPIADIDYYHLLDGNDLEAPGEHQVKNAMQRFTILFETDRQRGFATSPRIFGDIWVVFEI